MKNTPLEFPYAFDTRRAGRFYALTLAIFISISLFLISPKIYLPQAVKLSTNAALSLLGGLWVYRKNKGAKGLINKTYITIKADKFLYIPSGAPNGEFLRQDYIGIKNDVTNSTDDFAAITMVGRKPAYTLIIGGFRPSQAQYLTDLLCRELSLPNLGKINQPDTGGSS